MRWMRVAAVAVAGGALLTGMQAAHAAEAWASVLMPAPGSVSVLGSPAAGCIRGAEALPAEGDGYQVLRLSRNRFYGHPRTVRFVRDLGAAFRAEGMGELLIGDMAQPRGGPMPAGHGSHQNGLDVDIWFRLSPQALDAQEREAPVGQTMVKGASIDQASWTPAQARLLELAARADGVDRIFVNPAIKREMCRRTPAESRQWLAKLRPWWGHDEHFHVRLTCPAGDVGCEQQAPVPEGDGCGAELDSWLAKPLVIPVERPHRQTRPLPAACRNVVAGRE